MAWWHAVPQPPPSKVKNPPKQIPETRSRMQMRLDAKGEPDLPELDPALQYFVGYLFDAGPVNAAGVALTWGDLEKWERGSGVTLQPWQSRMLRAMSGAYLAESRVADEHDAPPPWVRVPDRKKVAAHIRNVLRGD